MIAAKGLTRRFAACAALVAFALLSFVSALRADTIEWAGVTIAYTNAVVTYSNPDDLDVTDLILTYTDTSAPGSLTLPEEWSTRYLVVGGGGAGGTVKPADYLAKGQGGGGGAGGFLTNTVNLAAQTYSISVGAGGTPAADQSAAVSGGDGGGSSITISSSSTTIANALGGGGGGAQTVGRDGGSGGGGSPSATGTAGRKAGGSGVSGQGSNGGAGNNATFAAGGGGAGAKGKNTSSSASGAGGAGLQSDITGELKYYAGGGGGGRGSGSTATSGGLGGGGAGSPGTNGASATPGEDETGGGGGGGGHYSTGAAGGSGIVVIRLLMPAVAPSIKTNQLFTGEALSATNSVSPGSNWELYSGTMVATNAGNYAFSVVPKPGLRWKDNGGTEVRTNHWQILQAVVPEDQEPHAANLIYNGEEQCGVIPSSSGFYTLSNARQTAAGNYTATATLNNLASITNCTWHDGTTGERTINFTIEQLTVKRPTAIPDLHYNGNLQNGIQDSEHAKFYVLGGETNATITGSYLADATIGTEHQGNCVWETKSGDTPPTDNKIEIPWSIGGYIVARPTAKEDLVYNGENQVGVVDSSDSTYYTISGVTNGVDAVSYSASATLKNVENFQWAGEALGVATIEIPWSIAPLPVAPVTIPVDSFEYDTNNHCVVVWPAGWSSYSHIAPGGVTNAAVVGEYSFIVELNDLNHIWNTSPKTHSPITISWSITKALVQPPTVNLGLVYNSYSQQGTTDSSDSGRYAFVPGGGSVRGGVNAGDYFSIFRLNDPDNNCWTDGSSDDLRLAWSIAKAPNSITVLKLSSWKAEENPVEHEVKAESEWPKNVKPHIDYSSSLTGPWEENQPTNVGIYYVRATVAETPNWAAAERTAKFSIWSDPDRIFRDYVDLRVQGYRGTEPLTNFPLLVRISESRLRGFYYSRAGLTGEDMVFLDTATDTQLPYEVDTWNVTGESLVWVRVSVLTNDAPIRMYWTLREGAEAPGYTPEDVWTDYVGVWHFADQDGEPSSDSTDNKNFAYPYTHSSESISNMIHGTANIGRGRTISRSVSAAGGCRLVVSNTPSFLFNGKLTISGWLKMSPVPSDTTQHVWPFSRRNGETAADTDFGAFVTRNSTAAQNLRGIRLFGSGTSGGDALQIWPDQVANAWSYFGAAYNGASAKVCGAQMGNVTFVERPLTINSVADSGENLAFGNIPGANNTYNSFAGMVDEYRLTPLVRSRDWLNAEFDTVNDTAFCTNSLVVKDGLRVNYWTDYPAFAPLAMEAGEYPTVCYNGRLAEGWASTNYVNVYDSTTNSAYPTAHGSYRVVFALDESFTGYELLEPEKGYFNFALNGRSPYTDIAGNLGDSGRILLMNRHMVGTKNIVRYQGYSYNTMDRPVSVDNPFFWDVIAYSAAGNVDCPNLKAATESIFWTKQHGAKLWHLINCRHGNTVGVENNKPKFKNDQNYFSYSSSSYSIDNREISPANATTAGQIVMRNIVSDAGDLADTSAAVYSPCYDDGIGTIYFDAVNGWNNNIAGNYGIRVDICTNVLGDTTHLLPPTDENITRITITTNYEEEVEVVTTNIEYYAFADWQPVPFVAYKRDNTADFVREEVPTSGINLAVANGGTTTNFYRMVVPLDLRTPARFRIRRTTRDSDMMEDGAALIMLDNILVSYPAMTADLRPLGFYDHDRRGKQVLGQEIAFEPPFPAQTDADIRGRAEPYYYVNPGDPSADTNNFIVAANLHYRWRYLRQRADPTALIAQLDPTRSGYYNDSLWRTVPLNPRNGYRSIDPLVLPAAAGDVEFWYDLTMNTPYYEYVDYSGLGYGVPYDERQIVATNHFSEAELEELPTILPTTGVDWFVRLREGKSDFERLRVVVDGVLAGEYEMDVIEDNMWRALVKVPVDVSGPVSFYFVGLNQQVSGAAEFATNKTYFCPNAAESTLMPGSGKLVAVLDLDAVKRISTTVDNTTGYIEFKLSDRFLTWGVSRAEYQNFNNWSDAYRLDKKFCVSSGTNGVDDVAMKTFNLDMSGWRLYDSGSTNWNEAFYLPNYNDQRFPKETFFQDHGTPQDWIGHNLTFVSRWLKRYYASSVGDPYSGMAGKLQGCGEGYIDFNGGEKGDRPLGLESVGVSARIGQSISYDTMNYSVTGLLKLDLSSYSIATRSNYTFFAPVYMSDDVPSAYLGLGSKMAVGAAVSVVAYYWPGVGCYEFRISRLSNNANDANDHGGNQPRCTFELYRWSMVNGRIVPTKLCDAGMDGSSVRLWGTPRGATSSDWSKPSVSNPRYWGMFISVENTDTGTLIIGGVSETTTIKTADNQNDDFGTWHPLSPSGNIQPNWNDSSNGSAYRGIAYRDNSASKLTFGSYGVAAKDCAARFVAMHHYDAPVPSANIMYGQETGGPARSHDPPAPNKSRYFYASDNKNLIINTETPVAEAPDLHVEDQDANPRWALQSRLKMFNGSGTSTSGDYWQGYRGLYMPDNLAQDIVLMLQPAVGGEWQEYARATVKGYGYTNKEFLLHTTGQWNTRITTGADNVDLVVGSVTQNKWEASDYEYLRYGDDEFVYTQGVAVTNKFDRRQELILQPSRGEPTKAMSMRAPILENGLGKISFSYCNADVNAEIWVQMATNSVEDNIERLNTSIKEGPNDWTTICKLAGTDIPGYDGKLATGSGKTSTYTYYLGLHSNKTKPLSGVFRLFVPTNIIVTARANAYLTEEVNYGKLTICGMTVTDEPALSERSWRGWNLRTVGDSTDSESRMYLPDITLPGEVGSGLVGALNNTVGASTIDDSPERARADYPTVYSPTFDLSKAPTSYNEIGIGSVDFRARLYTTTTAILPKGGKIWLYGSKSSVGGPWTLLGEYVVDSPVMKTFSWSTFSESYLAVKFAIADSSAREESSPEYERIILDEITVREKVQPSVSFLYARPFRNYLFDPVEVDDILSPSEQPIVGESWGVQAKVLLRQLADEIDTSKGFRVTLSYYRGDTPWGYMQWRDEPSAVTGIELVPVGDPTNLVFRSVGTSETTLVPPAEEGGVVQFQLFVHYTDRGGVVYNQRLASYSDWTQPEWYYPVDKNVEAGGDRNPDNFSPYTILDTVSPGRAWINEFNYNDGTAAFNGGTKPVDNQFIELCIPSGVDMSGWRLRLTDIDRKTWVMAKLGANGLPSSKVSPNATNNFEFYLLESPVTDMAGGINRRTPGAPEADGTWNNDGSIVGASSGTLNNEEPYQLELIRPNGIIEHQIVFQGTNRYPVSWGYTADALARELARREDPVSPKRQVLGGEVERAVTKPTALGSSGVVGGEDSGEPAPGEAETWRSGLQFTPGWLNEGQIIPENWYTAPNGVFSWVYFVNNGPHIVQTLGTNTAPYIAAVVLRDSTTNVVYDVARWYAMNLKENNIEVASGVRGHFVRSVTPTSTTMRVVASEVVNPALADDFGLDENNPYSDSVFNWLTENWPDSDADDIRAARFRGLNDTSKVEPLSLTEMYWLDIPPVPESDEERNSPDHGSNWWLRAGITYGPTEHKIYRTRGTQEVCYTNHVVDMTMYITNTFTGVVHAPQRLQGLENAQSDNWSGAWTSETFKVRAKLNLSWLDKISDFLPFRFFIFNANSFAGPSGATSANVPEMGQIGPYSARIEILDPHSAESIGANYGWQDYPNTSGFYLWSIDTEEYPFGVQTLKYDDTYPAHLTP